MLRGRLDNLHKIRALDPERDYVKIVNTMVRFEFPWDLRMAMNLAFSRSFSTPTVAKVLVGTGELLEHTQKRLDDTGILMKEVLLHGFDGERGRAAMRRINQIHKPFRDVPEDEYRFVLGAGLVMSLRWVGRYGWRPLDANERQALYLWYRELGRMMKVGVPDTLGEFEVWYDAYDEAHLVPSDEAAAVERATRMRAVERIPRLLAPLGESLVSAMFDERLRTAVQVARPSLAVRAGLHTGLKTRALLLRHFGRPRKTGLYAEGIVTKTYPHGYQISEVGPA